MRPYRKTVAAVGGFLVIVGQALANGEVDAAEGGVIFTAAVTALGVFLARNQQEVA